MRKLTLYAILALVPQLMAGQARTDSTVTRLLEAGFANVRAVETDDFVAYSLENDRYVIPAQGFARARQIIEGSGLQSGKPVKLIGLGHGIPEVTMTYSQEAGTWRTTKRLDESWDAVRKVRKQKSTFGNIDLLLYPQVSFKNLIINQVYQSLWQLCPTVELTLWQGAKATYQIKLPIYNDGYSYLEDDIHTGVFSLSQRFRDPWRLNIFGKATVGAFTNGRYGAALEMSYWLPNERFWLDTQLGYIGQYYNEGFVMHYYKHTMGFRWNVAANYYNPELQTQFLLRAQQFLEGDKGIKYEMIRHFRYCSVGFYMVKGFESKTELNVGFRFQAALPAYRMKRHGHWPKVNTSGQMGVVYNANNEQKYYKEFKTEASDNIMSTNYFNPYYLDGAIRALER